MKFLERAPSERAEKIRKYGRTELDLGNGGEWQDAEWSKHALEDMSMSERSEFANEEQCVFAQLLQLTARLR